MTTFTPNDIAGFIFLVGGWGPGSKAKAPEFLDIAIAVCLAESSGDENAQNPPASNPAPERYAVGLWQIMYPDHKDLLQQYAKKYSTHPGTSKLYTHPLVNTAVARDLQQQSGWQPWEAYTSGAYKKYLGHGKAAYAFISNKANMEAFQAKYADYGTQINDTVKTGTDDINWRDAIASFPQYFVRAAKQMGVSIGVFLVGLILLVLGIWFLVSQTKYGKEVNKTAKNAAVMAVVK